MSKNALLGSMDEKYRIYNFAHDIKEAFLEKILNHNIQDKGYTTINTALENILFDKITLFDLISACEDACPENGTYGVNTLVSCGDKKRLHPHAFIIHKDCSCYSVYFLDPEYSVGQKDTFSPSITNGFRLQWNQKKESHLSMFRLATKKDDKDLNKLGGIYNVLQGYEYDMFQKKYSDKILMNIDYKNGILQSTKRDKNYPSSYTKSKIHSTSYILSLIAHMAQGGHFREVIFDPHLKFTHKIFCDKSHKPIIH